MRSKTRVVNFLHARMLGQEICNHASVLVVCLHPYRKRLCPAQYKEGIERREDSTNTVLNEFDPFRIRLVVQSNKPADAVRMAVKILCRRVNDDVASEIDRFLKVRG